LRASSRVCVTPVTLTKVSDEAVDGLQLSIDFMRAMPELQVIYYTGEWSEDERTTIRAALEDHGFDVAEDYAEQKSWAADIPPQVIVDAVQAARDAAEISRDAAPFVGRVAGLLSIFDRFRGRKKKGASMQVRLPRRIYVVLLDPGATERDSIAAVVDDYGDRDDTRRGDMTWRDGRWLTVEELHGRPRRRPPPPGSTAGRKREGATRVRLGRKGRRGQAR
jgi:hypothetical protein